jgi:hypothetical protein
MPDIRGQRSPASASCARLQSRQFPAHAGDTGADQRVVADQPGGEADQGQRQARQSRPPCRFPHGRGRHLTPSVRRDPAADCRTPATAGSSASVNRRWPQFQRERGEVCLDDDEIDIPDAEPTGVNGPAAASARGDGRSLSIWAQERSISRMKAVIGWMSDQWHPGTRHEQRPIGR